MRNPAAASSAAIQPAPPVSAAKAGGQLPRPIYYWLVATLAMFLLANAFGSSVTTVINTGKWLPLIGLCAFSLNALIARRAPVSPPAMLFWVVSFFALAAVSSCFSILGKASFGSWVSIVLVVLSGYAIAALIVATDSRREFFNLIAILGRVLVASAFVFYVAGVDLGRGGGFSAWVDNPNTFASMMAPACIVFIAGCIERRPGWKYKHLPFLVVSIPLMMATQGRASYVWVLVGGISFWVYRRGTWPTAIALMISLIVLIGWWEPIWNGFAHWAQLDITPQQAQGIGPLSGREEVWRVGAELFREQPIFGYGMGSSNTLVRAQLWRFVRFQGLHFHSSYIMTLVETGLMGFVPFMGVMLATLVRGVADAKRTRPLPRDSWPTAALPFAIFTGALGHALFESWLIAGGNVNAPLFWTIVWLIHFQAQIPIRAVVRRAPARVVARRSPAYPAT